MSRSPLFYPLNRGDADAGGAGDLQTDIMRFMAILALCLVAIFALVQSIPLIPEPVQPIDVVPVATTPPAAATERPESPAPAVSVATPETPIRLTRQAGSSQPGLLRSAAPAPGLAGYSAPAQKWRPGTAQGSP